MHYFPFCCGVPLDTCMPLDTLFSLVKEWRHVGWCTTEPMSPDVKSWCIQKLFSCTPLNLKETHWGKHSRNSLCSAASQPVPYAHAANLIGQLLSGYFVFSYGSSHFSWALCCHGFCCNFITPLDFFRAALQSQTSLLPERHVAVNWGNVSVGKWKEWCFKQTWAPFQNAHDMPCLLRWEGHMLPTSGAAV